MINEQQVLCKRLLDLRQTGSFEDYCTQFRAVSRRVTSQNDEFKQSRFLEGSNRFLRQRFADREFTSLAKLIQAALQIQTKVDAESFEPDGQLVPVVAAVAAGRTRSRTRSKDKPSELMCYRCKKPGHVKADCRVRLDETSTRAERGSRTSGRPVKGKARFGKYDGSGRVNAIAAEAETISESEGDGFDDYEDEDLRNGKGNDLA